VKKNYKPNLENRPPHLKITAEYYFITCRTINGQWFLQPPKYKTLLFDTIHQKSQKFATPLLAYVILHNHYHLIIKPPNTGIVSKFIKEANGASARAINKADGVIDRKIWWNYFDSPIKTEPYFYKHLNYIHQNPVKHGVSNGFSYHFSSYDAWKDKKGKEFLDDSFSKYPIVDFVTAMDDY